MSTHKLVPMVDSEIFFLEGDIWKNAYIKFEKIKGIFTIFKCVDLMPTKKERENLCIQVFLDVVELNG